MKYSYISIKSNWNTVFVSKNQAMLIILSHLDPVSLSYCKKKRACFICVAKQTYAANIYMQSKYDIMVIWLVTNYSG